MTVTPEEEAALQGRAFELQVSVPRLLVEAALSDGVATITERRQLAFELSEVRRLLANIANNTNQIAKYANTEGSLPEWADAVAADYTALRPELNAIINGLAKS